MRGKEKRRGGKETREERKKGKKKRAIIIKLEAHHRRLLSREALGEHMLVNIAEVCFSKFEIKLRLLGMMFHFARGTCRNPLG